MNLALLWDFHPPILTEPFEIRWYGVLFATGFAVSYYLMNKVVKKEGMDSRWLDRLLLYIMVGTVVGARLGHVFFYEWDYYKDHLFEILMLRGGGLASHGGAIGVSIAMWLFYRKNKERKLIWTFDRVAIFIALTGVFIRVGNMANHEIVGLPTDAPTGVVFAYPLHGYISDRPEVKNVHFTALNETRFDSLLAIQVPAYEVTVDLVPGLAEKDKDHFIRSVLPGLFFGHETRSDSPRFLSFPDDPSPQPDLAGNAVKIKTWGIPRHPTQLWEALAYLLIFVVLYYLFLKRNAGNRPGFLIGMFLILIFGARFSIEFIKAKQTGITTGWWLNMGHVLSIPCILIGVYLVVRAMRRPPLESTVATALEETSKPDRNAL